MIEFPSVTTCRFALLCQVQPPAVRLCPFARADCREQELYKIVRRAVPCRLIESGIFFFLLAQIVLICYTERTKGLFREWSIMPPGRARSGRDPACSPIFIDVEQIFLIQSVNIPLVIRLPGRLFTTVGTSNFIHPLCGINDKWNHNRCAVDFHINDNNSLLRVLNARFRVDCPQHKEGIGDLFRQFKQILPCEMMFIDEFLQDITINRNIQSAVRTNQIKDKRGAHHNVIMQRQLPCKEVVDLLFPCKHIFF